VGDQEIREKELFFYGAKKNLFFTKKNRDKVFFANYDG